MIRSRMLGVGTHFPPTVVTNDDLAKFIDTSDEWITQRTGIKERRWVVLPGTKNTTGESTSDLALKASERALEASHTDKSEIELIIFATLSPDHQFPGSGCYLQAKLGLGSTPALDIRQQCSGFIYGLSIADQFIRSGTYEKILVVGAEVHSMGLDKSTDGRDVTVLFGDGAGAVVVGATEVKDPKKDRCILSTHLHADGTGADELTVPAPGMGFGRADWVDEEMIAQKLHFPKMNGKRVYVNAVKRMSEAVGECLTANALPLESVDLFLFHQANLRINEAVAQALNIPWNKVFNTIEKYGNTTAATIPIGMDEAVKAGVLKEGMLVATAAFGSGFTWASSLIRW